MRKSEAAKILYDHSHQLFKRGWVRNPEPWRVQALSFISEIFGKDSSEYRFIETYEFTDRPVDIQVLGDFMDRCVMTLDAKGTYKKGNFISRISEGWMIFWVGLLISAIVGAFTLGYNWKSFFPVQSSNKVSSQTPTSHANTKGNTDTPRH
jgi:hypothetical protein